MTEQNLPDPIQRFIATTNGGDSTGFVSTFAEDAVLDDWGRVFTGQDGVTRWNTTDNIGVGSHFELVDVVAAEHPDTYVVTLRVTGGGYNGTGPMTFTLDGDRIARLVIAP